MTTIPFTISILHHDTPIVEAGYTLHAPDVQAAINNALMTLRMPMTPEPHFAVITCHELNLSMHPLWSAPQDGLLLPKP